MSEAASPIAEPGFIRVPGLSEEESKAFSFQMVHIGWKGGFEVPEIPIHAVDILEQLPPATCKRIFTHKSFNPDPDMNYEILEYVGDAAILFCTTILIEEQYADLLTAWRHLMRVRATNRECLSRIAIALNLGSRVQLGPQCQLSQGILEDLVEAIAGGIQQDLGTESLMKWCRLIFTPVLRDLKKAIEGEVKEVGQHLLKRKFQTPDPGPLKLHPTSKADLVAYCEAKGYSIHFERLSTVRRANSKQAMYTESVKVNDRWYAEERSTSARKAQAAACQSIIQSGVLPGIKEFREERDRQHRERAELSVAKRVKTS